MRELLAADEQSKSNAAEGAQKKAKKKKKVSVSVPTMPRTSGEQTLTRYLLYSIAQSIECELRTRL